MIDYVDYIGIILPLDKGHLPAKHSVILLVGQKRHRVLLPRG